MNPQATVFQRASEASRAGRAGPGLPPELVGKARRRLAGLAAVLGSLSGLALLLGTFAFSAQLPRSSILLHSLSIAMALVLVSLSLAQRVAPAVALHAGLAYEVALCWAINLVDIRNIYEVYGTVPHLTWASMIIVIYPMVVPLRPRRLLVASALAAISSPVATALLRAEGAALSTDALVGSAISPAFAVVIAYFGARMIYATNVDASRARRMGAYRLEERLGAGGMGEVWRASHRMLARPAAVKLIAARHLGADSAAAARLVGRFEQEAQATASLRSPHTVELYDFGVADDGSFYFVMELLEGLDLEELVKRHGPLPPARVVHILRQVCHSLAEAHATGLIHRDMKPANIFLCRYGSDDDFVKVLDFGLVKARKLENRTTLSNEETMVGTPAFIAPEVALGAPIDGRADLYALGCVAYWLLTGSLVFESETRLGMATQHASAEPSPPSARGVDVPADLEQVVMALLAKRPDDRPPTAQALDERLAACAVGHWTQAEAKAWWEQHEPV